MLLQRFQWEYHVLVDLQACLWERNSHGFVPSDGTVDLKFVRFPIVVMFRHTPEIF